MTPQPSSAARISRQNKNIFVLQSVMVSDGLDLNRHERNEASAADSHQQCDAHQIL
jgi:hypothetical protein